MYKLKKLIAYFFGKEKTTTFQDIYLCTVAALTASFLFYEGSNNLTRLIFSDIAITLLVFTVWAYCGFVSGRRRCIGFPVFAGLYWCVPYVFIIYYASRDNVHNYVKFLSYANRISRFIFERPFSEISEKLNISSVIIVFILMIITGCAYFIGFITAIDKKLKTEPEGLLSDQELFDDKEDDDDMSYLIIDDSNSNEDEELNG